MKTDHYTITPFCVKVMSKYKVLSKCERGMIKKISNGASQAHKLIMAGATF